MDITQVFCPPNREAWRLWLETNHLTAPEIWLQTHHINSGMPRVGYDAAVEEALCFGWIDGITMGYVMDIRKANPAISNQRLEYLIKMSEKGKMFGTVVE